MLQLKVIYLIYVLKMTLTFSPALAYEYGCAECILGSVNKILIPITATECILILQIFFWLSFKVRYL